VRLEDLKESFLSLERKRALEVVLEIRNSRREPKGFFHKKKARGEKSKILSVIKSLNKEELAILVEALEKRGGMS